MGTGPVSHPRIDDHSVVQPLPQEELPPRELPMLPVVGPHKEQPAAPAGPASTEFLPRATVKTLVFDLPGQAAAPTYELELPQPPPRKPAQPPPVPSKRTLRLKPPPPLASPREQPAPAVVTSAPIEAVARVRAVPQIAGMPPRPAPLLIDVTPIALGVETVGGFCDTLIEANTPVPCDRTRSFATASDGQIAVRVRVAQGPSKRFDENTFLGEIELAGIVAAPRGETQIAVTFEIDADGILNVRARDIKTGHETAARIQLVGAQTGASDMEAMQARQAAHPVAL
jgi:molecular chaperone DnaK